MLEGIGEDTNREGLKDTPARIARMYTEIFEGMDLDAKDHLHRTFTSESDDIVVEKDITFYSIHPQKTTHLFSKCRRAVLLQKLLSVRNRQLRQD